MSAPSASSGSTWEWVTAPWDDDDVDFLNRQQTATDLFRTHPYTCAYCRDTFDVEGIMIARRDGWFCLTHPPILPQPVQTLALLPRATELGPLDHIWLSAGTGKICGAQRFIKPCTCYRDKDHTPPHVCGEPTCGESWIKTTEIPPHTDV
jgi:hypothetical protein